MADEQTIRELLEINQRLLDSIARGDWAVYENLCDSSLTAYEPESQGQLVEGLDFHHFFFRLGGARGPHNTTMCNPRVRLLGEVAIVTYGRLNQRVGPDGQPTVSSSQETRVWKREGSAWKHVHFHRSK